MKKEIILSCTQIALIALTIMALSMEWAFWWVFCILWACVSILGILLTVPIVFVVGISAGAAQADWMSDTFVFTLFFVLPTVLAIGVTFGIAWYKRWSHGVS